MISVRLKGETSPREIAVTCTNNDYGKGAGGLVLQLPARAMTRRH